MLSRDKEFIVFYRGKDFLPSAVSSAIAERRKQVVEEEKKSSFSSSVANTKEHANQNDQKGVQGKKKLTSMEAAIKRTADKLATVCVHYGCIYPLSCRF